MACDRNQNLIIRAACRLGVSRIAGKSAFLGRHLPRNKTAVLVGSVAVAGLAATIAVGRGLSKLADGEQQGGASGADLPEVAPRRKTPAGPTQAPPPPSPPMSSPGPRLSSPSGDLSPAPSSDVRLDPRPFDLHIMGSDGSSRLVRLEKDAFAVLKGAEETGLAVVREPAGKWTVTHVETGMALAGDMDSVYEAEGLAVLLSPVDWNQPFDEMPQAELQVAGDTIGRYQAQLGSIKAQSGIYH